MSRPTPPRALSNKGCSNLNGTRTATQNDASGLSQTLQGHVDDIRSLLQCGICIRPLYEPFTLACGHTFCYGCLTSWFAEGRSNKTCPDCRAPVKSQPAPAYLVRAVVQLFTSRAELLEKGETTDQHRAHQLEEAQRLEVDKNNTNYRERGLFRGVFNKTRLPAGQPIVDLEDNVVRCPRCAWELEDDSGCLRCGFGHDGDSLTGTDWTESEENSEMTDDVDFEDNLEDGFGEADHFDWDEFYDGVPLDALPTNLREHLQGLHQNPYDLAHANGFYPHDNPSWRGSYPSPLGEDDDEETDEEEDEDMDSFIDDEEPSDDYDSDSDRSTVVGHNEYNGDGLHGMFDDSASSEYSTALSERFPGRVPPIQFDDEDEEEEERDEWEDEVEDENDEEGEGDEDEDEEPIRPPIQANRRRIPTYHIISSSPVRVNDGTLGNPVPLNTSSQTPGRGERPNFCEGHPTGSSTVRAIAVDDDSDEGPVGPVRRIRGRGNR